MLIPTAVKMPQAITRGMIGAMARIKDIGKSGYNKDGKYAFIYYGDVLAAVHDALVAEKINVVQRQVAARVIQKILCVKYTFDIYHEDGDGVLNMTSSTGACRYEFKVGTTDDKSWNKAYTAGLKVALLSLFKIPPDDNQAERFGEGDADADGRDDGRDDGRGRGRGNDDRNGNGRGGEPDRSRGSGRDNGGDRNRGNGGEPNGGRNGNQGAGRDEPRDAPPPERSNARGYDQAPPDDTPPPPDDVFGGPPPGHPANGPDDDQTPPEPAPSSEFRNRVTALHRQLNEVATIDDASRLWLDNQKLLDEATDTTYEWLRDNYNGRWHEFPPAFPSS